MTSFVAGDKSKAICFDCKKVVETTLTLTDVPFSDGIGLAKDVLAGVCNECAAVVSLPAQSTPDIVKCRNDAMADKEISPSSE